MLQSSLKKSPNSSSLESVKSDRSSNELQRIFYKRQKSPSLDNIPVADNKSMQKNTRRKSESVTSLVSYKATDTTDQNGSDKSAESAVVDHLEEPGTDSNKNTNAKEQKLSHQRELVKEDMECIKETVDEADNQKCLDSEETVPCVNDVSPTKKLAKFYCVGDF